MTDAGELRPQVVSALVTILAPVDGWAQRSVGPVEVQAGSRLEGDDRVTAPIQLSHATKGALVHAVDHLIALKQLILAAGTCPLYAAFSLARGAIETAATGAWLLSSDDQATRVRRRIKLQVRSMRAGDEFREVVKDPAPKSVDDRLAELVSMGAPFGIDQSDVKGTEIGYGVIVRQAAAELPKLSNDGPVALWMMCSALAHGEAWATHAVLDREILTDDGEVLGLRLTAPDKPLVAAINIAALLTREAWALFDRHRVRWVETPGPTPTTR